MSSSPDSRRRLSEGLSAKEKTSPAAEVIVCAGRSIRNFPAGSANAAANKASAAAGSTAAASKPLLAALPRKMSPNDGAEKVPKAIGRGAMDVMSISDQGDTATVTLTVESELRAFERAPDRRFTPEDQKIDFLNDKGLDFIPALQDVDIRWG